jgi:hypothetical protein
MKYTIAKSSLRQSKLIYYLLYLELRIKRYQFHKLNRSVDVTADISNAAVPMQNHRTKPVGPEVNGFASSRG